MKISNIDFSDKVADWSPEVFSKFWKEKKFEDKTGIKDVDAHKKLKELKAKKAKLKAEDAQRELKAKKAKK